MSSFNPVNTMDTELHRNGLTDYVQFVEKTNIPLISAVPMTIV
jgi:hypothetical protein